MSLLRQPVACLTETGDVEAGSVAQARRYLELAEEAGRVLGRNPPPRPPKDYYQLIRVVDGIEPFLVGGWIEPTKPALRQKVVEDLRRTPFNEEEDALFVLSVHDGKPVDLFAFSGAEMEKMQEESRKGLPAKKK